METVNCNNAPTVIVYSGDHLEGVFLVEIIDGKITNFYAMRNPHKLAAIAVPRTISASVLSRLCGADRAGRRPRQRPGGAAGHRRRRGPGRVCPPAALIGEWFGSRAVIAPSVSAEPVDLPEVFAVPPGSGSGAVGGGWFGYLSYPDAGRCLNRQSEFVDRSKDMVGRFEEDKLLGRFAAHRRQRIRFQSVSNREALPSVPTCPASSVCQP